MKKVIIVCVLGLVAIAVFMTIRFSDASNDSAEEVSSSTRFLGKRGETSIARTQIDEAANALTNAPARARRQVRVRSGGDMEATWVFEDGTPWPDAQKELMREILALSDNDDYEALAALSSQVASCENEEIRDNYVDELGWFGEKAFVDMAAFLSDPSEDVVDSARTHIADAFQEIDSDAEKAVLFSIMVKTVNDNDLLETLADELITMDAVLALQTIADTIAEGTTKAQKSVKEVYETITDEKWAGIDDAEAWLQANYEDLQDDGVDGGYGPDGPDSDGADKGDNLPTSGPNQGAMP